MKRCENCEFFIVGYQGCEFGCERLEIEVTKNWFCADWKGTKEECDNCKHFQKGESEYLDSCGQGWDCIHSCNKKDKWEPK